MVGAIVAPVQQQPGATAYDWRIRLYGWHYRVREREFIIAAFSGGAGDGDDADISKSGIAQLKTGHYYDWGSACFRPIVSFRLAVRAVVHHKP